MNQQPFGDVVMIVVCCAIFTACNLFGLFYKGRTDQPRWIAFILSPAAAAALLFLVFGRAAGIP